MDRSVPLKTTGNQKSKQLFDEDIGVAAAGVTIVPAAEFFTKKINIDGFRHLLFTFDGIAIAASTALVFAIQVFDHKGQSQNNTSVAVTFTAATYNQFDLISITGAPTTSFYRFYFPLFTRVDAVTPSSSAASMNVSGAIPSSSSSSPFAPVMGSTVTIGIRNGGGANDFSFGSGTPGASIILSN